MYEKEPCNCGHSHEHKHHHAQEAVAVSGQCEILTRDSLKVKEQLRKELEMTAKWIQESGGVVGHIKAGIEQKKNLMYSITDQKIEETEAANEQLLIKIAVIVYLMPQKAVEERVQRIMRYLSGTS